MSKVVDNLNRPVAEGGIVVTLRSDATGGVSLGGDASIEPGETRRLPAHLALPLLQSGKAVRVAVADEVKEEPGVSESAIAPAAKPKRGK